MLARVVGVILLMFFPLAGQAAETPDFGAYHALIIGNNGYQHLTKLKTAQKDAVAVARVLQERYGFETELLLDATRTDIINALAALRATLTETDNLLIYYAGHGHLDEVSGEGYWLPVDAERESPANWVSNNDITSQLKAIQARHVMVVADSCYAGTLTRKAEVGLKTGAERQAWLSRMAGKRSRTALISGGLEPVLDAGGGEHSVFARAFLEVLGENRQVVDGQSVFDRIKGPVVANADQTPGYETVRKAGDQGGDFLFVPVGAEPERARLPEVMTALVAPPVAPQVGERTMELAFWDAIEDSTDPAEFREFLKQFPDGTFAGLARLKIKQLRGASAPPPAERKTALLVPPKPVFEVEEMENEYVVVKNANLREGPSAETPKLGILPQGAKVTVTGKVTGRNWYRVSREGKRSGYVFGALLQEAALVVPPKPAFAVEEMEDAYVVVRNSDVYEGPSEDAAPEWFLPRGTQVLVRGKVKGADWYLIEDEGERGYVPGRVLRRAALERARPSPCRQGREAATRAGAAGRIYNVQPIKDRSGLELTFLTDIVRNALASIPNAIVVTEPVDCEDYDVLVTGRISRYLKRQTVNPDYQGAEIARQIFGGLVGVHIPTQHIPQMLAIYDAEVTLNARDRATGSVVLEAGAATLKTESFVSESDARGNALQAATSEAVNRLIVRLSGSVPPPRPIAGQQDKSGQSRDWSEEYSR